MKSVPPATPGAGTLLQPRAGSGSLLPQADGRELVLIVDDVPDNLALLHDALDAAGYGVLVATDGASALARAAEVQPAVVLLDALMPGLDGFEVARRLKADADTAHIPIVFMTGLSETEHVLAAFDAGGADYVTKPIRPREVLARIAVHVRAARQARAARNALDAYGHATIAVRPGSPPRVVWQTPLARRWLEAWFPEPGRPAEAVPEALETWLAAAPSGAASRPLMVSRGEAGALRQLVCTLQGRTPDGDTLLVLREVSEAAAVEETMRELRLTQRESEVLVWVAKGKTNRDIGDILGASPATVKKHLEHVFGKLGVETRTAAAAVAMQRVRSLARE